MSTYNNTALDFVNNDEQYTQIICVMCRYSIDELDEIFEFNDKLYCSYCHTNNNLYNENDNESDYFTDYEYSEDYD